MVDFLDNPPPESQSPEDRGGPKTEIATEVAIDTGVSIP